FEDRTSAQQAMNDLLASGFSQANVRLTQGDADTAGTSATLRNNDSDTGSGFMNFFRDLFGTDDNDNARLYSDAVTRGHYVLTVDATSDAQVDSATDIIDNYNPIDIDERASQWGTAYQTQTGSSMGAQQQSQQYAQTQSTSQSQTGSYSGAQQRQVQGQGATTIPVVQEELRVGKREVQRGGVRVVQRVVETPVQESIGLREEHVKVERHAVDRPVDPAQASTLFKEGSMELRETAEEAVVQKSARVVEEVTLGKEVTQRQQQVSDTVRRTEVDIDKLQGQNLSSDNDTYFRKHWTTNYGSAGGAYEDYAPAYQYGSAMASNEHYRGRSWDEVEPNLRSSWELNNRGTAWDKMKAAVREGWNRMTT
ncbi:MAG TPA: YsnF/AvaK domain-containing protein, partial [Burkholderiaceae bacterium]